jgi:hypothetical protein
MGPDAATSPMVASNPDGRGAVYGSVVTTRIWQATRYDKGSSVVPISLTDFPFFWEGSVIYQLVYELPGLCTFLGRLPAAHMPVTDLAIAQKEHETAFSERSDKSRIRATTFSPLLPETVMLKTFSVGKAHSKASYSVLFTSRLKTSSIEGC